MDINQKAKELAYYIKGTREFKNMNKYKEDLERNKSLKRHLDAYLTKKNQIYSRYKIDEANKRVSKLDKELYALITIPGFPATAFENVQTLSKTLQKKLANLLLVDKNLEDYVSGECEYPLSKADIMKTIASLKKLEQTKEIDEESKKKNDSIKAFKNMNKNLMKIGNTIESYMLMLEEDASLIENSNTTTEDIDMLIEKLQKLKSRL